MRLIDADALIEILRTAVRNMKGVAKFIGAEDDPELKMEIKAYTDILNGVKEQPTIEPEPHWISCGERLPEEDVEVLVTDDAGGITTIEVDRCGMYENTKERFWYTSQHVIAWMPLPEPYQDRRKGEDKENVFDR